MLDFFELLTGRSTHESLSTGKRECVVERDDIVSSAVRSLEQALRAGNPATFSSETESADVETNRVAVINSEVASLQTDRARQLVEQAFELGASREAA